MNSLQSILSYLKYIFKPKSKIFTSYLSDSFPNFIAGNVQLDEHQLTVGSLRIFAILPERLRDSKVSCIVQYADFSSHEIVAEEAGAMHDVHNNSFAAWSIMCPLQVKKESPLRLPKRVALSYASNYWSHASPKFIHIR